LTFCWPCISVYLSQYLTNLMHKICFTISFISCLYMFRAHVQQNVKTCNDLFPAADTWYVLHEAVVYCWSAHFHHTLRHKIKMQICLYSYLSKCFLNTDTHRCDDTGGYVIQFWPPDDEHMCPKHVEAWNKTYCETNFVHQVG